ncbi:beta-1,6-N-acetylglucosaminyltransferase [Mesotoga sp.]|uniref:beta-1,6-N-acetylglucosaminyltransferase n=1 Tax=Mesotoga sp. TaxID=2053577 RepID=UPI00345EE040
MLAYIVLVHKSMKQVVRLIRSLEPDRNVILIHVDIRVKDAQYDFIKSELREYSNVMFVGRRKCNWGKFDLVSVTLDSMRIITGERLSFSFCSLLSGQDFPIKSTKHIEQFLKKHVGNSFIDYFSLPSDCWQKGGTDRYKHYHFNLFSNARMDERISKIIRIRRRIPAGVSFYGGSQWWTLNKEAVEFIDHAATHSPRFVNWFRNVFIPDEMFFQTMLINSELSESIVNDNLRYIVWPGPKVFGEEDTQALLDSGESKLFGRKFDETTNGRVLSIIENHIQDYNQASSAFGG